MRTLLKYGAVALVALIIGVAIGTGSSSDSGDTAVKTPTSTPSGAASAPTPEESTPEESTPEPAPEPDPKGSSKLNCDYTLGDFGDSGDPGQGYRFIAGGSLRNTGNIGIVARVRFTWEQLGQAPIVAQRIVRLPVGKSKRVNVTMPATEDQVDLLQSSDAECKSRVKITDTFGTPQP